MFKNKLAVITPTIRLEGLKIVQKALEEQDFEDFDWYICSPKEPKDCWGTWIPDTFKGGCWTLNRAYNQLIRQSNGELIVSWQDYTYGDPNILSTLWEHYQKEPKGLVSILGNKYMDDTFFLESWFDPRQGSGRCNFNEVEWNLCSCPREGLYEIGGFDEGADWEFLGMDGYGVNERLDKLGYKFFLEDKVKTYSLMHGRVANWEELNGIHGKYTERKNKLEKWPRLDYLLR